ncbi:MAG: aminotransferase class V-fold PLP-dependent enzyme [Spirochaetaceae bacterium]|jgi:cysteine desulfurase|nr:aminotransferase class V-fold PLP-dependent enzyme [Spirochaetaceae bacterium]
MKTRHYFDWAATAVPDTYPGGEIPFGNPSSAHREGRLAREALEGARLRCAGALGVPASQLYFTSGGSESNAIVLGSMLLRRGKPGLALSVLEHPSMREGGLTLSRLGVQVAWIGSERDGRVSPEGLARALGGLENPRLVSVMLVNNETGAVMDLPSLARAARETGPVHVHSDLVQALGKIPFELASLGADSASFSAHKIGGPRGVGLLWLKKPFEALISGSQERGLRPGTENVGGALAFASALEAHGGKAAADRYAPALGRFTTLIRGLRSMDRAFLIPGDRGEADGRFSPYILQCGFRGIPGEVMARVLDDRGFAVSTGSACSSSSQKRPVLDAMGLGEKESLEGIRISQGWATSGLDIEALLGAIEAILKRF